MCLITSGTSSGRGFKILRGKKKSMAKGKNSLSKKIRVLMMNNFDQLKLRLIAMVIFKKNEANEFLNVNYNF